MDLHAWITQQVDRVEEVARARLIGHGITLIPDGSDRPVTGTITEVRQTADGLQLTADQYGVTSTDYAPVESAAAILRRCEADRRILDRHRIDPAKEDDRLNATACIGCGTHGDCDWPATENINDCPELLDLAHAHGLTEEQLAQLDRPQPPETKRQTPAITTADVPAALRGSHWRAR